MDQDGLIGVSVGGIPNEGVQAKLRHIERHERRLWCYTVSVTILLTAGIASFALPALLSQFGDAYAVSISQAVRGLVGLILIFTGYMLYQQMQLSRLRRQLTEQAHSVDKVEMLAEEVYKLAVLDSLTGLFNRRYAQQRLRDEISRCKRHGHPLTVIFLDLDNFKEVNDNHGHEAGDMALNSFAERLSRATRGCDVAARYGGDEFLVLLPECKTGDVQCVLNRLEGVKVQLGEITANISFSAGWANYLPDESPEDLLRRADDALYANKRISKEQNVPAVLPA
jgi:diguanylate cyclase (GGDEF)-like protein